MQYIKEQCIGVVKGCDQRTWKVFPYPRAYEWYQDHLSLLVWITHDAKATFIGHLTLLKNTFLPP